MANNIWFILLFSGAQDVIKICYKKYAKIVFADVFKAHLTFYRNYFFRQL